jgi:hypothetical protein
MSMLKLLLLAGFQMKVRELVLSITSCHSPLFYKILQISVQKNVVYVTLITDVSPVCLHPLLVVGNFMKVVRASRPPMKWSAIAESLRNTAPCVQCLHNTSTSSYCHFVLHVFNSSTINMKFHTGRCIACQAITL